MDLPKRKLHRLKSYDYSNGYFFVTICTNNKKYGFEISERRGRRSLQGLMKDFKSVTTRIYKKEFGGTSSLWQKSYYDEIIEHDEHFQYVWQYIDENPRIWNEDKYF